MKILTKILSFQNQNLTQLHPIVLKMCNTIEDYIACLDSNIHFTKVHTVADKKINPYPLGKLFNRHENIIISEEGNTLWDLKESSQATMFYKLAERGVVSGTCNIMRQQYGAFFKYPVEIKEEDIVRVKWNEEYLQNLPALSKALLEEKWKEIKKETVQPFNKSGVTREHALEMCKAHYEEAKKAKPKHPLTDDQIKQNETNKKKQEEIYKLKKLNEY